MAKYGRKEYPIGGGSSNVLPWLRGGSSRGAVSNGDFGAIISRLQSMQARASQPRTSSGRRLANGNMASRRTDRPRR